MTWGSVWHAPASPWPRAGSCRGNRCNPASAPPLLRAGESFYLFICLFVLLATVHAFGGIYWDKNGGDLGSDESEDWERTRRGRWSVNKELYIYAYGI